MVETAFQMYFNTVLTDSAKLLKPLLVFTFAMLAILAGLTRIIQFRNHPVDVYCGWILGAAIAIYLVTMIGESPLSGNRSYVRRTDINTADVRIIGPVCGQAG